MAVVLLAEDRTNQPIQRTFIADTIAETDPLLVGDLVFVNETNVLYRVIRRGDNWQGLLPLGVEGIASIVSSSVADPVGTTQAVTITVTDSRGIPIRPLVRVFVAPAGQSVPIADPVEAGVTVSAGTLIEEITEDIQWILRPGSDGKITLTFDNTGGSDAYAARLIFENTLHSLFASAPLSVPNA